MLAGFVAGEGCFCSVRLPPFADGSARRRFVFQVTVAQRDRALLERLQRFLGYGSITDRASRRPGHQPTSALKVASFAGHREATIPFAERYLLPSAKRSQFERWRAEMEVYLDVVVPFMDEHLPPSYKREQYLRWRHELISYWEAKARRRGPCKVEGCVAPSRCLGLCRRHYYKEHRR